MQDLNTPDIAGLFIEKGWLYKSDGMVFGPAPAQTIIDRIYAGQLKGEDEVAEGEGLWTPLRSVQVFYPHVIQAEAKFRSAKIEAEKKKAAQKKAVIKGVKTGGIALTCVIVLVASGLMLNKYRPWERFTRGAAPDGVELRGATMDEWVERHPPLVSLGLRKQMKEDEKKEALAKAETEASKVEPKRGRKDKAPKKGAEKAAREEPPAKDGAKETKVAAKSSDAPSSQGGDLEQISDSEIYQTIQSNISKLFVCLRDELKRTPDLRGQLEIEFVIKNDGHVGDVFIDDFRFKEGPLKECFKAKLASWHFSRYSGERRIVKYPFFIGKK